MDVAEIFPAFSVFGPQNQAAKTFVKLVKKMKKTPDKVGFATVVATFNKSFQLSDEGYNVGKGIHDTKRDVKKNNIGAIPMPKGDKNKPGMYPGLFEAYGKENHDRTGSRILFSEYDSPVTSEMYNLKSVKE